MSSGMIFVICFGSFLVLFFAPIILYFEKGLFKWWYHDVLKWHQPDNSPGWNDGCSVHSKCKWCGKDIMQDSQGNWF